MGRAAEVVALRELWESGFRGVAALVGLGGAGKTAVAARFLEQVLAGQLTPVPSAVFVWSFYQEPDAGQFLFEAMRYFAGEAATAARGTGLLHLVREALTTAGPCFLVLDGLERVQRQEDTDAYGQLEDPLLKGLLLRIAEGVGQTVALVTSRFPLADLRPHVGQGYRHLEVGGLDDSAARDLLRQRGVSGDDDALQRLVDDYGAHPLTLDHLGGLIGQFRGGDPTQAPDLAGAAPTTGDRQGLRLARLLRAYETYLPPTELALLTRLCLLRRSVTPAQLDQLLLCNPQVHARTIRNLADWVRRAPGANQIPDGDLISIADVLQETVQEFVLGSPLAGPEESFKLGVCEIAETMFTMTPSDLETAAGEVARAYSGKELDGPTAALPLPLVVREQLPIYFNRYQELRVHPALDYKDPPHALEAAFQKLNIPKKPLRQASGTLPSGDVLGELIRVSQRLKLLTSLHFALQRLHALCRLRQRKWALAGPLAPLDAAGLLKVLNALVGRHLVLREADGSYSVHPAVRDYFGQLARRGGSAVHDLIRDQLVTLVWQSGRRLPEDPATLDLVEEAIHHALAGGRTDVAVALFQDVLGGVRHLAWKLGEMNRGLRLLRAFNPCPDRWALAWFLRSLGELDAACEQTDLPYFRADLRLLQGELPRVVAEGEPGRAAVAEFLMGLTAKLPPSPLGCPVPRDQLLLYRGRMPRLPQSELLEAIYQEMGWEGERSRCLLLLAEAARRQGDFTLGRRRLEAAAAWVLKSGSVEHLCLLHLQQARLSRSAGDAPRARLALDEGLHLARHAHLGLYHIELLCEEAELALSAGDAAAAERSARDAHQRATAVDCQFQWGAAAAGHLLGQALVVQRRLDEARPVLEGTLLLRQRLGDPRAEASEELLAGLP